MLADARRLLNLREELASEEARLGEGRVALARRYFDEEPERVEVPAAELAAWLAPEDGDAA